MLKSGTKPDTVQIDPNPIVNDEWSAWYYWFVFYGNRFPTYESYANFFIDVGNNHPDGIGVVHLAYFVEEYTKNLIYGDLIREGILIEEYTADGTPFFRLRLSSVLDSQ